MPAGHFKRGSKIFSHLRMIWYLILFFWYFLLFRIRLLLPLAFLDPGDSQYQGYLLIGKLIIWAWFIKFIWSFSHLTNYIHYPLSIYYRSIIYIYFYIQIRYFVYICFKFPIYLYILSISMMEVFLRILWQRLDIIVSFQFLSSVICPKSIIIIPKCNWQNSSCFRIFIFFRWRNERLFFLFHCWNTPQFLIFNLI